MFRPFQQVAGMLANGPSLPLRSAAFVSVICGLTAAEA
jgi:hypothetical protein